MSSKQDFFVFLSIQSTPRRLGQPFKRREERSCSGMVELPHAPRTECSWYSFN